MNYQYTNHTLTIYKRWIFWGIQTHGRHPAQPEDAGVEGRYRATAERVDCGYEASNLRIYKWRSPKAEVPPKLIIHFKSF